MSSIQPLDRAACNPVGHRLKTLSQFGGPLAHLSSSMPFRTVAAKTEQGPLSPVGLSPLPSWEPKMDFNFLTQISLLTHTEFAIH